MKKSEMYHLAQIAVVGAPTIAPESKLEIIAVLMANEKMELFCEGQEAKETVVQE